jgi:SHS2 domain-containing protein
MAKQCEPFEHTADVGLAARADTPGELFEAMAEGLAELICRRSAVRPARSRTISVQAEDIEALAVDYLSAILSAIQEDRFLVAAVEAEVFFSTPSGEAGPASVRATLRGETYDPSRHEILIEVKAVTYHRLQVARRETEWQGRVILDL